MGPHRFGGKGNQLARKLRVYEIAKELGLSNKEALDLCLALGVDVKNHSSSVEEAHADRIRRRAQRDHLGIYAEATTPQVAPPSAPTTPPSVREPEPVAAPEISEPVVASAPERRPDLAAVIAEEAAKREEAEQAAIENAGRAPEQAAPRRQGPLSPSGNPIPPPPGGRPLSPSGKPIPPPPRPQGPRDGRGRPAREGSGRPVGGSRPGAGRPGTGGGRPPMGGGIRPPARGGGGVSTPRFGGAAGAFAGRPGGGRGRGVRPNKSRRRISRKEFEELEPTRATAYVPSNDPVPDYEVIIERGSTAQEVAPKLNRSPGDLVRFLLMQGEMVTATQSLTDEMIELYAAELGAKVRLVDPGQEQEAQLAAKYLDVDETLDPTAEVVRPPVVTVMGHVDHGKTLLLDRIRHTNVVAGEAGGITQHIGAYQVDVEGGRITFIDTPGHEAFTAMRARGASVTDIVILVVAADDGVMPQTVEAINHAKAAGVPIIVAINKIDRPDADPNRVMQQLSEHGLVPEAWGGDTITVQVSALQSLGIDELLEQVLVLAEVLELRANPTGRARGVVLEGHLDVGRGPVATVLVQGGTLHVGDPVVAGQAWGKAKALISDRGEKVSDAGPSTPVQVLGFSEVPSAGDPFRVTAEISHAREIGEAREQRLRLAANANRAVGAQGVRLEDIFEQIQQGEVPTLNLIVKADVQGSLEALSDALAKLSRDEVRLEIIHKAVGGITENDVTLAAASHALIIGFNVRPDRRAREAAEVRHVEIRTYEIIYQVIEDIEAAVVGMLKPEFEEVVVGEAEVREVFRIPRVGAVAGCYVRNGTLTRGGRVRFLRDGVVLWKGTISSLRRFKEDVREVQAGFECGVGLSDFQDLHAGDIIEAFELREIPRG
ncbi:translation initiation factor IF-2 [Acidimicrobium ferrooxidans DSM 10331]|uniref:Translation initiation factor IF-2 n=1 Tax=Acidimicrobium ferrooxidans (strain DSM 10331 / JCM 15462 / NBRC 103882 / ICP) TaxID=525909 RepID=C7LXY4_ACIFD|nr:translation initiation factor IF-2 [Acidimicrobium ferrooxidans]ACU53592.1 translation initiation factor IF-2 [Acidimicrobium ferrooxidans DSM 10331]